MDSKKRSYRRQRRKLSPVAPVDGVSSAPNFGSQGVGRSVITAAARALAAGDPLGALNWVALRDDAPALALRGIAMARLGDLIRAKALLRRAERAFGPKEPAARARCVVAEAEIALVSRDLGWPAKALSSARTTLAEHGDSVNAAYARHLEIRHLLLIGRLDQAEQAAADLDQAVFPPVSRAAHELVMAGIALRRLQTKTARAALSRAQRAAQHAPIPALMAEIESVSLALKTPAARLIARGQEKLLLLEQVESLLGAEIVLIDACRYNVRSNRSVISLARRPVLFALARTLAEAWPNDVPRSTLIARAFGGKRADESHRARLRVEIGRLRKLLRKLTDVSATMRGFALVPRQGYEVAILARPVEEEHAGVLAFLADGESWSSSALAVALGASQRTVQRALDSLAAAGKIQSFGRGRALRWMTPPVPGFTTILLLPAPLPID
jgi:DNA-binding winged helix-turn-helix (wHTH) protein